MAVEQSPEFKKAVEESRKLKTKPSQDELLEVRSYLCGRSLDTDESQLYALFKQGSQDPPFEEAPKPGMMDLQVC